MVRLVTWMVCVAALLYPTASHADSYSAPTPPTLAPTQKVPCTRGTPHPSPTKTPMPTLRVKSATPCSKTPMPTLPVKTSKPCSKTPMPTLPVKTSKPCSKQPQSTSAPTYEPIPSESKLVPTSISVPEPVQPPEFESMPPTTTPISVPTLPPTTPISVSTLPPTTTPISVSTLPITEPNLPPTTPISVPTLPPPSSPWPTPTDTISLVAPQVIAAGETFDGGMKMYERTDLVRNTKADAISANAVFIVQPGGVLKNVMIGNKNIIGVFCESHNCLLDNVWHVNVCMAAVVVEKGTGTTSLMGGGAKGAAVRVILHKAGGSVRVTNFIAEDCKGLVESCATCGPVKRSFYLTNVDVIHPIGPLVQVNQNYKDVAVLSHMKVTTTTPQYPVCALYDGGKKPTLISYGRATDLCDYEDTSIQFING